MRTEGAMRSRDDDESRSPNANAQKRKTQQPKRETMKETITINGVEYVKAEASKQEPKSTPTTIKRNDQGIVDYCLDQVEMIDSRDDLDIEKKARYGLAYIKEARNYVSLGLQNKKLMMQSPDIAKNANIVLPVGSSKQQSVEDQSAEQPEQDAAAG
jgi:hypothetical protein